MRCVPCGWKKAGEVGEEERIRELTFFSFRLCRAGRVKTGRCTLPLHTRVPSLLYPL